MLHVVDAQVVQDVQELVWIHVEPLVGQVVLAIVQVDALQCVHLAVLLNVLTLASLHVRDNASEALLQQYK